MASLLSFEDGEADVPSDISLGNSAQSVVPAHSKARPGLGTGAGFLLRTCGMGSLD